MAPLAKLVIRRCLIGLIVMWAIATLTFFATQGLPGDTARAILGQNAAPGELRAIRAQLGLNHSVWHQYVHWLSGVVQGHLGTSFASRTPVVDVISNRIAGSLTLMLGAALIAVPCALTVGVLAATRRGGLADRAVMRLGLILGALPEFVIGVLLIVLFATGAAHIFPAVSLLDPQRSVLRQLHLMVLPIATLGLAAMPHTTFMIRAAMMEALESEYATFAQLNGIPRWRVVLRHTLPNAVGPTAQVIALALAYLAGGVISVEVVFGFPGIGAGLVDAVRYRDLPVVQALVLFISAVYVVTTLAADIFGIVVSPRRRTALR